MDTPAATYPPSWVDRLLDWIDALPGPTWVLYTAVLLAIALATHAVAWAEGLARVGTFDPLLTSLAVYLVGSFAAIHYLDLAAARAWVSFRPATRLADVEAERVAYQLTTMPVRPTLGWTILGLVLAVVYSAGQYGQPLDLAGEPLTFGITAVAGLVSFAGAAVLIYHTLRQLRLIRRIHDYVESIDLLQLEPLHAFAGVTATTGVYLLGFIYLSALTDPATFANPALLAFMIAAAGLAIASFVAPLYGIHVRIAAEKSRRLGAVNRRLDGALRDLDRRAEDRDLSEADAVNKHLSSLLAEREVMARTPTWPWSPETLRGFVTAIILPIVLWLVFRFLEQSVA